LLLAHSQERLDAKWDSQNRDLEDAFSKKAVVLSTLKVKAVVITQPVVTQPIVILYIVVRFQLNIGIVNVQPGSVLH